MTRRLRGEGASACFMGSAAPRALKKMKTTPRSFLGTLSVRAVLGLGLGPRLIRGSPSISRSYPSTCILIRLNRRRLSRRRRLVVVRPHGQPLKDGKHLCHVRAHEIGSRPKLEGIAPITAVCMREPSARRMLLALPKAAVPKALERLKHVLETALLRVVEPPIAAPNEFEFEHRDAPTREQCPRALEHESVLSFRVHAEQVDRLPWPQLRGRKGVERRACDLPREARPSASVESKAIGINSKVIRGIQRHSEVLSGTQPEVDRGGGTRRPPF